MKRSLPMLFVGLGLAAAVCAGVLNGAIAMLVAMPEGATVAEAPTAEVASAAPATSAPTSRSISKRQYIEGILKRNIFDHTAIGQTGGGGATDGAITDLDVTLFGTLVSTDPEYSIASIAKNTADAFPLNYGIGDKLEDATIVAIENRRVTIRRSTGAEEHLVVEEDAKPAPRASAGGSESSEDDQVSKDGENSYTVDRELVDKYLADMDALSRMGRAIPHRGPDGQIDGYRLSGIRRGSVGEKLGIRNGDIVHAVNGQELTSVQSAMGAYGSLQNDSNFSFEVTRRGQKMSLKYEIR